MGEKTNKPSIRFAGFTDAWERRKARDLFEATADKNHPELPVLAATQEFGMVKRKDNGINIYHDKRNEVTYKKVLPGQFVIHLRSFQGGFAHSAFEGITSPAYTVFGLKAPEKHCDYFWKYIFHSEEFIRRLETVTYGIRDGRSISYEEFLTMNFLVPSYEEQKQISTGLLELDRLIILQQRKHDKLVNIKKSMLEKMFPQHGTDVPEIRFAGFTDAWEQRKFDTLYAKSSEKNDGSIGVDRNITVATMQFKPDVKVSTDDYLKTYYTFNIGDIAFEGHQSKEFRFGRFVENDIENGIVSHIFAVFRPIVEYDLRFWKYAINNERLMQSVLSRSTKASTMMHDLVVVDFLNEEFLVPAIDEQKAIGDFLTNLDHLIALHQRKLTKLQNIKKSCLEKMFV